MPWTFAFGGFFSTPKNVFAKGTQDEKDPSPLKTKTKQKKKHKTLYIIYFIKLWSCAFEKTFLIYEMRCLPLLLSLSSKEIQAWSFLRCLAHNETCAYSQHQLLLCHEVMGLGGRHRWEWTGPERFPPPAKLNSLGIKL
uniref:Uncharacterized protein n=1 Tax=Micrurus carvalhoi TaxID=3147026 RepID=A0A2H6NGL3_9SAUR